MKKILYIEDSQDTAEAVKLLLTNASYQVEIASNGIDGIKKAGSEAYDLYLLDIMLPDMSGWDIFEKLKDEKKSKFAFLSAIPISSERMNELKKAGIADYITKPFTKKDLIKRVKKILK